MLGYAQQLSFRSLASAQSHDSRWSIFCSGIDKFIFPLPAVMAGSGFCPWYVDCGMHESPCAFTTVCMARGTVRAIESQEHVQGVSFRTEHTTWLRYTILWHVPAINLITDGSRRLRKGQRGRKASATALFGTFPGSSYS